MMPTFLNAFEVITLNIGNHVEMVNILMYFAFTTLSTVGFGDYYPVSNMERLVGCVILIAGVAIFSLMMGKFIEILTSFKEMNNDYNESDDLMKFFGLLKKFNNDRPLKSKVITRIQNFFDYRWSKDKNVAFLDP